MASIFPIRYRNGQLEYLMIKRTTLSYNWQWVTGSVGQTMGALDHPADESPLECAIREMFEETGYSSSNIISFDPPEGFFAEDEGNGEIMPPHLLKLHKATTHYNFIARIKQEQDPILNPSEHTDWRWCSYEEAYELILWAVEKKGLRIVNDYLVKNPL